MKKISLSPSVKGYSRFFTACEETPACKKPKPAQAQKARQTEWAAFKEAQIAALGRACDNACSLKRDDWQTATRKRAGKQSKTAGSKQSFFKASKALQLVFLSLSLCLAPSAYSEKGDYSMGASLNASFPLNFYQAGWNSDTQCYPGLAGCVPGQHKGYAWIYTILPGLVQPGLGLHIGMKTSKNIRLELSADGFINLKKPKTKFEGLYYRQNTKPAIPSVSSFFDGAIRPKANRLARRLKTAKTAPNEQLISVQNDFSRFQTATVLANIYGDISFKTNWKAYLGLGAGFSLIRAQVKYKAQYVDANLNSEQNAAFQKLGLSARLKTGLSYTFPQANTSLGIEGSYTMIKSATGKLPYKTHPNQTFNSAMLRDIRFFSLALKATQNF